MVNNIPYFQILPKRSPGKKITIDPKVISIDSVEGNVIGPSEATPSRQRTRPLSEETDPSVSSDSPIISSIYSLENISESNITLFKFSINDIPQRVLYSGTNYRANVFVIKPDCVAEALNNDIFYTSLVGEKIFVGTNIFVKNFDKYKTSPSFPNAVLLSPRPVNFQIFRFTQLHNYDVNDGCHVNCNLYKSILKIGKANYINSGNCGDRKITPVLFSIQSLCLLNREKEIKPCSTKDFCGKGDCYGPCEDTDQFCKIVKEIPTCVQINENNITMIVIIAIFIVFFMLIAFVIFATKN